MPGTLGELVAFIKKKKKKKKEGSQKAPQVSGIPPTELGCYRMATLGATRSS
jgi:hypothetical protein